MSVRKSHSIGKNHIKLVIDYYESTCFAVTKMMFAEILTRLFSCCCRRGTTTGGSFELAEPAQWRKINEPSATEHFIPFKPT